MSTDISRHFVTLGHRQVHYRRAGGGPPVLLLHQSPASSAELVPLIQHLMPRFTVIAPDMPGYGGSDRLDRVRAESMQPGGVPTSAGAQPSARAAPLTIAALADDLERFMLALGIDVAGFYGFHTGASIATAFARRHPRRVAVAIAEGLLCLDATELDELPNRYLEPFVPRWDGSHLAWLWSRLKDQSVFFPWYERTARARLDMDAASPAALAAQAENWLRSGEHYRTAYRAAMEYDPRADIGRITTPHFVIVRQGDPLAAHLPRLHGLPPNVRVQELTGSTLRTERISELFGAHCAGLPGPLPPQTAPIETGIWQDYVGSPGAQLRVLRAGADSGKPVLVQHGAQSSAAACEPLLGGLALTRAVYAVELPGHGLSDAGPHGPDPEIEELAGRVRVVMCALGLDECDCVGIGAGAPIVVELQQLVKLDAARRHARMSRVHSLLIAPIDLSGDRRLRETLADSYVGAPIDSHGGYLLKAWHEVRDHQLFFPWFERRRAYALAAEPALAPESLQAQTVAHVLSAESGIALRRREARYRLLERLRSCDVNPGFAAPVSCPRFPHTRGLAHDISSFLALPAPMADWPGALLARLDG